MPTKVNNLDSVFDTGKFRVIVNKQTGAVVVSEKATGKILPPLNGVKTKSNTRAYLLTLVGMAALGVSGFIFIGAGRPADELLLIGGLVFGFVTTATLQIVNYIKQEETKAEAAEAKMEAATAKAQSVITHDMFNSRMTVAMADAIKAALAEGEKLGRLESQSRTDDLERQKQEHAEKSRSEESTTE